MCGIWLYMQKKGFKQESNTLNEGQLYNAFMNLVPRGPERSHFVKLSEYGVYIGFHRLSIMDPSPLGDQPFVLDTDTKTIYVICNGEIYNFKELIKEENLENVVKSGSDCEVLSHLYNKLGIEEMCKKLIGEFAICVCEIDKITKNVTLYLTRDHCGIRPMFITGNDNQLVISSEIKGSPFLGVGYEIEQFKPRNYMVISNTDDKLYDMNKYTEYVSFDNIPISIYDVDEAKQKIRECLTEAVKCRLVSDRPLGCLLSGGLDSSLVASIASKILKKQRKQLYTFCVGMENSTDEKYAKLASEYINSIHTHYDEHDEQSWINDIPDIVKVTETFDITTIRASTGQYKVAKKISQNTDIKVLLIGDGSDELCAGYMYFHNAPSPQEGHLENIRLINNIHLYDVLRADRGVSSNGLEARVPFLDIRFIKLWLSIDPALRMPINGVEKWLLRESFRGDYLCDEVLFRTKEAFSDGVSSLKRSWYKILQESIEKSITDEEFRKCQNMYKHCPPVSKESLYFRKLFDDNFGMYVTTSKVIPDFWLPKWVGNIKEPSARVLNVYTPNK